MSDSWMDLSVTSYTNFVLKAVVVLVVTKRRNHVQPNSTNSEQAGTVEQTGGYDLNIKEKRK